MIVLHRLSGWGFAFGVLNSSLPCGFRYTFSSRVIFGCWVLPFGFSDPDAFLVQQLLASWANKLSLYFCSLVSHLP